MVQALEVVPVTKVAKGEQCQDQPADDEEEVHPDHEDVGPVVQQARAQGVFALDLVEVNGHHEQHTEAAQGLDAEQSRGELADVFHALTRRRRLD